MYARKKGESAEILQCELDSTQTAGLLPSIQSGETGAWGETGCVSLDDFFVDADESRDILQRRERVRAKKAGAWIRSNRMIPNLVQVIAGTAPTESYLHFQLMEHAESTWTGVYGIQNLPLVQLVQLDKSPAVASLDQYWYLQTSGVDVGLDALVGVPGVDLNQEMKSFFQLLVDMSSITWRKLVYKRSQYPWLLAVLVDTEYPMECKKERLSHFFNQSNCCLEDGACVDLKSRFSHLGVAACLENGSKLIQCLMLMFTSKSTNVELENNFARSSSSRAYLRGKRHAASSMASKHLISELKHQHLVTLNLDRNSKKRSVRRVQLGMVANMPAGSVPDAAGLGRCLMARTRLESGMQPKGTQTRKTVTKQVKKVNGWSLFLADSFKQAVRPCESVSERYSRIRSEAKEKFQDPNVKRDYTLRAKETNKDARKNAIVSLSQPQPSDDDVTLLNSCSKWSNTEWKYGPWGLGDTDYPIAKSILQEHVGQAGSIQKLHGVFKESWQHIILLHIDIE